MMKAWLHATIFQLGALLFFVQSSQLGAMRRASLSQDKQAGLLFQQPEKSSAVSDGWADQGAHQTYHPTDQISQAGDQMYAQSDQRYHQDSQMPSMESKGGLEWEAYEKKTEDNERAHETFELVEKKEHAAMEKVMKTARAMKMKATDFSEITEEDKKMGEEFVAEAHKMKEELGTRIQLIYEAIKDAVPYAAAVAEGKKWSLAFAQEFKQKNSESVAVHAGEESFAQEKGSEETKGAEEMKGSEEEKGVAKEQGLAGQAKDGAAHESALHEAEGKTEHENALHETWSKAEHESALHEVGGKAGHEKTFYEAEGNERRPHARDFENISFVHNHEERRIYRRERELERRRFLESGKKIVHE